MRILVTGSRGAVGTHLVSELDARGHEVWRMDRGHHHEGTFVRGDVGEFRQFERVVDEARPELVYHLAAEFGRRNGEDFYETMWKSNAVATKNLFTLQRTRGFRSIIFSSSEVYGDYDGVMTEDVLEKSPIRQLNDYAISKWVNELQAMNAADEWGLDIVRVRLFNTYGPGERFSEYRSAICKFIYKAIKNDPLTIYTGHRRTSTYVTDTVRTLANIADRFKSGEVYNVGGEELHDMKSVNDMILDYMGLDDSHVTYSESEPMTTKDKFVDCSKARAHLDHNPTIPLEVGIPKTVDWMRSVYEG
ncbi:MAG: NAD-dependent epimerase/dehydratase family protein [Actinobacteria bacterium]|nr:NAD-dependent epimerase/dehydratase family protein [Actinomycetota bacterium]